MRIHALTSRNPLSKSRYLAGRQCLKRLFLQVRASGVVLDPDDDASAARMASGREVGVLAQGRHTGGVLIDHGSKAHDEAVKETIAALMDPRVPAIFEGAFTHMGVEIRVDLLVRMPRDNHWELHEVKSTKSVKDVHLDDLALQVWVVRGVGVNLQRVGILHLDGDYVRDERGVDEQRLFRFADRTAWVYERLAAVPGELGPMMEALRADRPPEVPTGGHCARPYPCPYRTHCGLVPEAVSPTSVRNVPNGDKLVERARKLGIDDVRELPADLVRSPKHKAAVKALASGVPHVSTRLASAMRALSYPLGFLDFETYAPMVPQHAGTRPMQTLPTQWSLHVLHADGRVEHREFLHDGVTDPRPAFAASLLDATAPCVTVLTYSHYEEARVIELMADLPEHAPALDALRGRVVDLMKLLQGHYYHPAFGRSYSLKRVAPVLASSVRYDGLRVANGMDAVVAYGRLHSAPLEERAELQRALLEYCAVDTRAMVEIWFALAAAAGVTLPSPRWPEVAR
ncbi:MAG: hypothetical protein RL562_3191 [Planctomycetota bacterium]|jgi:hypothetical protein